MTETTVTRPADAIAKAVVQEWLRDYRITLDPTVAGHLVYRIASGITADRQSVSRGRVVWQRTRALLVGSVQVVTLTSLIAIAALLAVGVVSLFGLIIFA
jgi:hypothetical protein